MQGCLTELLHPHGSAGEISTWDCTVGDPEALPAVFSGEDLQGHPKPSSLQTDPETTAVLTVGIPTALPLLQHTGRVVGSGPG